MNSATKLLFFKYAYPCIGTLVKRGGVKQEAANSIQQALLRGETPKEDERIFVVAHAMCSLIAKKAGKDIDSAAVREYFQEEHDPVIDQRFKEMGDFDPVACRVHPGKVLSVSGNMCEVLTPKGKVICKSYGEARQGSWVAIHYDWLIEEIGELAAKDLWGKKEKYARPFGMFPG